MSTTSLLSADEASTLWAPSPGYLAACTLGLPMRATVEAQRADLDDWAAGRATPLTYGAAVERGRAAYARLVGVPVDRVALAGQTSTAVASVAAAVPDGAEVVVPHGDFSSLVWPFLVQAHRGVTVRHVPLGELQEAVGPGTWLVAWSAVQSATGEIADSAAIEAAAARHGVLTLCDLTQAAGVLPVDAGRWDVSVCHAYKWLCCPRGVGLTTFSDRALGLVRPVQAGWYAGDDVWSSCYGPEMQLAGDARAHDVSPAWQAWAGALPALEAFAALDVADVARRLGGLGALLTSELDLAPQRRPVVTWPDPDGTDLTALTAAGLVASGRAGRARVAFHLWNDEDDVDRVVAALRGRRRA